MRDRYDIERELGRGGMAVVYLAHTVLDSGETAGRLWFTMPFVEGESLRDRIRRERQLPVDVALQIGRETARALDYAHRCPPTASRGPRPPALPSGRAQSPE